MTSDFREKARRLRNAVEPVAAGVYFAPEALAAYAALGFDRSPAVDQTGVARPELKSYFVSRGACMGQVPGEIVAAAFGCFNPRVVEMAVAGGWTIASRDAVLEARERGSTEMLKRVLGDRPEGLERVTELLQRAAAAARGRLTRCSQGCGRSAFRRIRSPRCGEPPILCASTGVTATSSPGR